MLLIFYIWTWYLHTQKNSSYWLFFLIFCISILKGYFSKKKGSQKQGFLTLILMVRLPLQTKRKHLRKNKNRKKNIRTNMTGFISWRTNFIRRRTGFICPADKANPSADEASPPENEASPFGLYVLTVFFKLFISPCLFMPKKVE